ncbi:MAG TPA: TlpA disulfide reductase family protein [Myxococcales bacterium]|nr:TlpA disulfide reductase family protein [Myxococcales bacterium]
MVRLTTPLLAAWLALGLGCASVRLAPAGAPPDVRLLGGRVVPWASLLAPQGTTLVVFATLWCEICRRERPAVQAWARAHPHRTVYVFSGGEPAQAAQEIRGLHLDPSALTVVVDADGRLADHFGVEATPTLLLLDPSGHVIATSHRFDPALN